MHIYQIFIDIGRKKIRINYETALTKHITLNDETILNKIKRKVY